MTDEGLEKLIIDFKKEYYSVFATSVGDKFYIWRPLTRTEYDIINKSSAGDTLLREEMICQFSVLFPKVNFSVYKAGIPGSLAPQILEESGFGSVYKTYSYLGHSRQAVLDSFTAQAEIVIASAFPNYTFEEMKSWNLEQILDMVARAEWKLNVIDHKDFIFEMTQGVPQEGEEGAEPKTHEEEMKELEQQIIEQGGDPILQLGHIYRLKNKKDYVPYPFIMGTSWDNEVVVNAVSKQLQSHSNK